MNVFIKKENCNSIQADPSENSKFHSKRIKICTEPQLFQKTFYGKNQN